MLENIWVIPAIPVLSFFLILFFGKRLPKGGSEIGVTALAAVFVLSVVAGVQWIGTEKTVEVEHHGAEAGHAEEEEEHSEEPAHEEEHSLVGATGEQALGPIAAEEGEHGGEEVQGGADLKRAPVERNVTWWESGDVSVQAGTYVDGLSIALIFVVATVSFLVHIYSTNYMLDDERYTHFFAALSLFTAGMLVLVTAGSTLQMMFGWELMGLCSFMLIGHWWEEHKNSSAALKAFFTTRTGDVGLLVGVPILFFGAGQTFQIAELNEAATNGDIRHGVLVAGAVALLIAVIGKSAQFPLHTWLPDAMAGPTPVSALIHAATMVVAGIYLVARLFPVFEHAGAALDVVAVVAAITMVIAAVLALIQDDIKKVLAYSTISQLGYMMAALGVGAYTAAIFHLFTHAFFKALLFLGSGSLIHAVHSNNMSDMGGLRKYMPHTFRTFLIGSLSLAGMFPLAGFFSKDEIIGAAFRSATEGHGGTAMFVFIAAVATAFLTALYMTRACVKTFWGEYRGHGHPHESPPAMVVPLWVLAIATMTVGFLGIPVVGVFHKWIFLPGEAHHGFSVFYNVILPVGSVLLALTAIWLGWQMFARDRFRFDMLRSPLAGLYRFVENRYYLDHLYEGVIVRAIREPIARAAYWINQRIIDAVVNGVGITARGLARFVYDVIDQKVIDGAVNGAGLVSEETGGLLRVLQTGRVQQYAAFLFGSAGVFAVALVLLT